MTAPQADRRAELWAQIRAKLDEHMPPEVADSTASTIRLWAEVLVEARSRAPRGVRAMELDYAQASYDDKHGVTSSAKGDGAAVPEQSNPTSHPLDGPGSAGGKDGRLIR